MVLTTGGTGFGPRDLTPEGTRMVIDREAPGLAEAMRRASDTPGKPFGMLGRGVCGTVGTAIVCNLPGSSNGALECLEVDPPRVAARARPAERRPAPLTRRTQETTMRAALYEAGKPDLILDDVDIDEPGPGRVRVRVHHCGICHSDYTALHSTYGASPSCSVTRRRASSTRWGRASPWSRPGDKVVLTPIAPCGRCYWCQRDQPGCCVNNAAVLGGAFLDGSTGLPSRRAAGLPRPRRRRLRRVRDGGETGAVKVPDDTPLETACVIGCAVQTGVGAVLNTAQVEPGATVLVLGLGGIGLSVVQGARAAGAAQIIASDPLGWRREAASEMGATTVLDPDADDVVAATRDLTGVGADYAFECAGVAALAAVGVEATRAGGTTVLVGAPPLEGKLELDPLVLFGISEKRLMGCFLGQLQLAARHPPHGGHVAGRPARPRGAGHRAPPARRDQRGLRRPRRRRRHPHRHRPGLRSGSHPRLGGRPDPGVHFPSTSECPRGWVQVPTGGGQEACPSL